MPDTTGTGVTIEQVTRVTDELATALDPLLGQLYGVPDAVDRSLLDAVVGDPANRLLVARDAGTVVGTVTVVLVTSLRGPHARIEDVVVDEQARGRGVGDALTRAALDVAAASGAVMAELTSRPAREAAQRLYRRAGFELVPTNVFRYHFRSGD